MSDHDWTQEHVAAYLMGGLTATEMGQVDRHARGCAECAAALSAARGMDRNLQALFADVRPGLELEDEAVRSTRTFPTRRFVFTNWLPRLAAAAVVLLALCMVGALADSIITDGRLPLPGSARVRPRENEVADASQSMDAERDEKVKQLTDSFGDPAVIAGKDEPAKNTPHFTGGQPPPQGDMATPTTTFQTGFGGGIGGGGISGGIQGGIGGNSTNNFAVRPQGNSYSLPAPVFYGGYPQPVQTMPIPPKPDAGGSGQQDFRLKNPSDLFRNYPQPVQTLSGGSPNPLGSVNDFSPSKFMSGLTGQDPQRPPVDTEKPAAAPRQPPAGSGSDAGARRIVIRSGDIEFEVTSFDDASAIVTKLVAGLNGAFVATVNSEKLPSGKVRGAITVRTPPEHLDRFVLDLRRELGAAGELKGMKIGSQDVTKQYTDLESRLRAARAMEQRLIQLIKDGKGEIKELLAAEKELGVWRTKIEEVEGEIRYYANLAALATLTVTLAEKEVRAAATISESERVQAGLEVEDVDKVYQQTLAAVAEVKGRVAKSELKQLSAGQFNASMQFEVPPEAGGPLRDRLRQLGRVARLEIDRVQHADSKSPPTDAKVKRGDTLFLVQIYNLANVAARETATLQVAVPDVRAGYQALRDAAGKATGRVLTAQLSEQDAQNVIAQFDFEVRRPDEGAIRAALDAAGEVVSRQVIRAAEGDDTTDSKVLYRVTFLATSRLNPRETTTLTLEVQDVDQALSAFAAQVAEAKGRQLTAQSTRDQAGRVSARAIYEVPLAAAGILERFKSAGTVRVHQSARDSQAPAGKFATARFDVTLVNRDQIVAADDGLWPQIRRGLSYSMAVLLTSVTWVVFGLCVVIPWGVAGYACYRLFRRLGRSRRPLAASSP